MSTTTKKFPVSVSFGDFVTRKDEFLVPIIGGSDTHEFMGISSGSPFPYGAVSYIGKAVSVADVLDKMMRAGINIPDATEAQEAFGSYLKELQEFRVGNVVAIEYSSAATSVWSR